MKNKNLPSVWQEVELGEACEIIMGQSPPGNSYNQNHKGIPFFQGKSEFTDRYPIIKHWTSEPSKFAKPFDILMSVRAPVGSINICNIDCCIGRGLAAIRCKDKIIYQYLFLILKSIEEKIAGLGTGSTFKSINSKQLFSVKIPLPPLPVQKKIVAILEKAESLKQKRKEADDKTKEYLQSVFYEMFGDPVRNQKKFDIKKLNEICDVRDGTHASPKYCDEGFPLITSKNLTRGFIDFSEVNLISKEDFEEVNRRSKVDVGDIIMPMIGTIGNPIVVPKKIREFAIKNVALIKFTKTKVSNVYIKFLLDSAYFNHITLGNNRGGTQKFIALGDIRNIPVPLPPLALQQKFASIVENVEKMKEKQKESKDGIDEMFNALMQKAFTGELVR